jgi:C_GCAxxG_C_C family probable redox protein
MSDDGSTLLRVAELSLEGFGCSQILVMRALEALGRDNPELVRAVSGLHGGLGFSGKVCGALAGGCCVIALHAGRGSPDEDEAEDLNPLIQELVAWFEAEIAPRHGGIDCRDILAGDPKNAVTRCPPIIAAVAERLDQMLARRADGGI